MEDNYSTELLISKNDYICRLIKILTPQINAGIKSILTSAIEMCKGNHEDEKYLMTFQNFLAQIPSWNQSTINKEVERIINDSSCDYLEDLVTCIHLIHFKIATSINVGNKSVKKIDINIPKFDVFIHQSYCEVARNIWSNIFLFHVDVEPLEYQKNMREVEVIVKDSLINTVRNNIPIKDIINTYLEESEEYLEKYINSSEKQNNELIKEHDVPSSQLKSIDELKRNKDEVPILNIKKEEKGEILFEIQDLEIKKEPELEIKKEPEPEVMVEPLHEVNKESKPEIKIETMNLEEPNQTIKFNNNDEILDMGTNKIEIIDVPKDINTLEKRSEDRYNASIDDDEDTIRIGSELSNIDLTNEIVSL